MRLQILRLDDLAAVPEGWGQVPRPPQIPWTDISVYELHIRDFSAMDESVPQQLRGSYLAFAKQQSQVHACCRSGWPLRCTQRTVNYSFVCSCQLHAHFSVSAGAQHLRQLQGPGLMHVHLLPSYVI